MPPPCDTFSFAQYELKAGELNSKFEADYNNCIETIERDKCQQSSEDHGSMSDLPPSIMTPKDAADRQKTPLRTKSSHCHSATKNLTITQKISPVLPKNELIDPPRTAMKMCLSPHLSLDTGDRESTLPQFFSVADLRNDSKNTCSLFPASKESVEKPPLLTRVSLEAKSRMSEVKDVVQDREIRKRLHYKEKLRVLTDKLTTSSAVERSREMLSNIMEKGNTVVDKEESNSIGNAPGKNDPLYRKIIKKLYSCSMRMCFDEAVVDHEGITIAVPKQISGCRCTDSQDTEIDENLSDVSSLTGATRYRFQSRHWMK